MNPPPAAGEEKGAAGGSGSHPCRGAEGGGEPRSPAAGAAEPEEEQQPGLAAQKDESLEEKLKSLTFRKQVSYRCWKRKTDVSIAYANGPGRRNPRKKKEAIHFPL